MVSKLEHSSWFHKVPGLIASRGNSRYVQLCVIPPEERESGSRWQAYVPGLPGLVCKGTDPHDAFRLLEEVLRDFISKHLQRDREIPWLVDEASGQPIRGNEHHLHKWVKVDLTPVRGS